MKHIDMLITIFLFFMISCNTKNEKGIEKHKVVKQYDYLIAIEIFNAFEKQKTKFILNNLFINNYDSVRFSAPMTKPLTLYCISYCSIVDSINQNITKLVPLDTTAVAFKKTLSDTLFVLTRDFFKNIEFNNYDTIGQLKPIIFDDSNAMIELRYGGIKLNATINSINNQTIGTSQLDTLINFITKFYSSAPTHPCVERKKR